MGQKLYFTHNMFMRICAFLQRQLETLGAQRAGLEDMLKDMRRKVHVAFDSYDK